MKKKRKPSKQIPVKKSGCKKIIWIIGLIILLVLAILIINNFDRITGKAIDPNNIEDPLGIGLSPEDIPENPEDAAQMGRDYLKKEWKIILNKSEFWGPMIRAYDRASPVINPLSRYSIGMQPEFSWLYLVNLVVGITLIIYLYRVLDIFSTFSKNVSLIISLALSVILAVFQVQPKISAGIVALIATLTLWWVQLIVVVLVMIALIYLDAVSGGIEKKLEEWKEKKKKMLEEEQEVLNRARLKIAADSAEKITRELGKGEE